HLAVDLAVGAAVPDLDDGVRMLVAQRAEELGRGAAGGDALGGGLDEVARDRGAGRGGVGIGRADGEIERGGVDVIEDARAAQVLLALRLGRRGQAGGAGLGERARGVVTAARAAAAGERQTGDEPDRDERARGRQVDAGHVVGGAGRKLHTRPATCPSTRCGRERASTRRPSRKTSVSRLTSAGPSERARASSCSGSASCAASPAMVCPTPSAGTVNKLVSCVLCAVVLPAASTT